MQMTRVRALAFRFVVVYFVLYIFPFPFDLYPPIEAAWLPVWNALAAAGSAVLGIAPALRHPTGSGDTLFNFVSLFAGLVLTVVLTLLWTAIDRLRTDQRRVADFFRVYLRFYLGTAMLSYGLVKVWKSQFPWLTEARLHQPIGDMTPMALLWAFMGALTAYTMLAGAAEVLGGLLLFFRRTTTLGALVVAGVMSNVVALNFCYDVTVKQYSVHLLLMALVLAAPDLRRLANVLVFNRAAAPVELAPSPSLRITRTRRAIGLLAAALLIGYQWMQARESYEVYGDGRPPEETYRVESMQPPLWKLVSVDVGLVHVLTAENAVDRWRLKRDEAAGTWTLREIFRPPATHVLRVERSAPDVIVLSGSLGDQPIQATLRRIEPLPGKLKTENFEWIQEYPNNR